MIKLPVIHFSLSSMEGIFPRVLYVAMDPDHPQRGQKIDNQVGSYWSLCYTYADAGMYKVDGHKDYLNRPANLIKILPPNFKFQLYLKSSAPIPRVVLHFEGGEKLGFDKLYDKSIGHIRIQDTDMIMGNILREIGNIIIIDGDKAFWEVQQYFCQCIDLLLRAYKNPKTGELQLIKPNDKKTENSKLKSNVQNYLYQNYMHSITLKDIAKKNYISLSKLTHTYSKIAGETPMQTLINYRIVISKKMIKDWYSLQQIADSCGFCDPFYFSKIFKKHTGLTPREYRDKL